MSTRFSVATTYVVWSFARSFLHRGWWLATSLYLVVEAQLSPFELVFLGTAQGLTVLAAEVPTGVFADAVSRKWSLVIAHALMGLGMLGTGLVLSFPALVVMQMVWGLSWTFSSGADVAWLTDEMRAPDRTDETLIRAANWGHAGAALGIPGIGALAWATDLATAIVTTGLGMWLLGIIVVFHFKETRFTRAAGGALLTRAAQTLRQSWSRLRIHRVLIHILLCTYIINGADEAFGRLQAKHLIDVGLPADTAPVIWFAALAVISLGLSIAALKAVGRFFQRGGHPAQAYAAAAAVGAVALVMFATSPTFELAAFSVLIVAGVATSVMRTVSVVWSNAHASNETRATVQSFLSLAENVGEVSLGFALAVIASYAGIPAAMFGSSFFFLLVFLLVVARIIRHRQSR